MKQIGSVEYWFNEFLLDRKRNNKSIKEFSSYFQRHILDELYGKDLKELTDKEMSIIWKELYEQGFSPELVKHVFDMMGSFFKYANMQGVKTPKLYKDDLISCRPEHTFPVLKSDLDNILKLKKYPDITLLCFLGAFLGIKRKKALSIMVDDIDLEHREILLRDTKIYKSIKYSYPEFLQSFLVNVITERKKGGAKWLFSTINGKQWNDNEAGYRVRKLLKAAGCQSGITYQSFRLYYAVYIDQYNLNRTVAETMMGIIGSRPGIWCRPVSEVEKRKNSETLTKWLMTITGGVPYLIR